MVEVLVIDHEVTEQVAEWRGPPSPQVVDSTVEAAGQCVGSQVVVKMKPEILKHSWLRLMLPSLLYVSWHFTSFGFKNSSSTGL